MYSKKSQAVLDFVMTYGWAVLAVIALIGILAFFGVLSPEKFAAEECAFIHPVLECVSQKVETGSITWVISNTQDREVTINKIKINECSSSPNVVLAKGADDTFVVPCTTGEIKEKYKADFEVLYTEKGTGLSKTAFGVLKTLIQ